MVSCFKGLNTKNMSNKQISYIRFKNGLNISKDKQPDATLLTPSLLSLENFQVQVAASHC